MNEASVVPYSIDIMAVIFYTLLNSMKDIILDQSEVNTTEPLVILSLKMALVHHDVTDNKQCFTNEMQKNKIVCM